MRGGGMMMRRRVLLLSRCQSSMLLRHTLRVELEEAVEEELKRLKQLDARWVCSQVEGEMRIYSGPSHLFVH
jgi:hypothetical protein